MKNKSISYLITFLKYTVCIIIFLCNVFSSTFLLSAENIGAKHCRKCHKAEYDKWSKSKHSESYKKLNNTQLSERKCARCHNDSKTNEQIGIHCESCHGGGQYYSKSYVMKDKVLSKAVGLKKPKEKSCKSCHNESSAKLKFFDYKHNLLKIQHWPIKK